MATQDRALAGRPCVQAATLWKSPGSSVSGPRGELHHNLLCISVVSPLPGGEGSAQHPRKHLSQSFLGTEATAPPQLAPPLSGTPLRSTVLPGMTTETPCLFPQTLCLSALSPSATPAAPQSPLLQPGPGPWLLPTGAAPQATAAWAASTSASSQPWPERTCRASLAAGPRT